jgi:hypothetical protein
METTGKSEYLVYHPRFEPNTTGNVIGRPICPVDGNESNGTLKLDRQNSASLVRVDKKATLSAGLHSLLLFVAGMN